MPISSTVVVLKENGGPWMHSMVMDHIDSDHNRRSYKIIIMKTGRIVTRSTRLMKTTSIIVEQYHRDSISK